MGSKQTRKQSSSSARIAVLQPQEDLGPRGVGLAKKVKDPARGDVVLVTLDAAAVENAKARRYFKRHLEALKTLSHPNLVAVHDGGTDDGEGRAYLVEAPCAGKTLRQVLAEGPVSPEQALRLAIDVLNGLAHAHHRGLVHGGLTPDGVLVETTSDGPRARIVDLGLARVVAPEQETPVGPVRVDTDYAAPEMIKGEAADERADVYSAGLLLHEMLTGKHPIPAPPKNRVLARLNDTAPDLPAGTFEDAALDDAVRGALRAALHKNPARRFASARAFALALRPGAQAGATGAAPVAAPGGGTCVACQAAIKPAAERTWSRHESDQPFECPACRGLHCGKTHWDARALSCKKCHEKAIAPVDAPAPEDVALVLAPAAPSPAPGARETPTRSLVDARREALRGLLARDSAEDWRTPKGSEPTKTSEAQARIDGAAEAPASAAKPAAAAPGEAAVPTKPATDSRSAARPVDGDKEAALAQLWAEEKARQKQAADRAAAAPAAAAPVAAPVAAPAPATSAPPAEVSGHKLVAAGLGLLLVFVVFAWQQDKAALRADARRQLEAEKKRASDHATLAEERGQTAVKLQGELDQLKAAEASLRQEKATLEERLARATAERAATLEEKRALEGQLVETAGARDALLREKGELDARLARATSSLEGLGRERAELEGKLTAASADREALQRRLGEVEAAQSALEAERTQLSGRLAGVAQALEASRVQREQLERRLRRALVRIDDQALELDDLQLQMVAASRVQDALADEKEALEARLAEAQELLRAQQDLLTVLSVEAPQERELAVYSLSAGGELEASGAATVAPAADASGAPARVLLTATIEELTAALDAAAEERGLLTVRVELESAPGFAVRVRAGALLGDGSAPADGWRVLPSALDAEARVVRTWLEPADAASLLSRGGSLGLLVEAEPGAAGAACRVVAARMVLTPLDPNLAARLRVQAR